MLKNSNPGKAYATLKKMGAQPGDCEDEGSFTLSEHIDMNLSIKESVEKIAQHFAAISQEYPPLNPATLPPRVRRKLETLADTSKLPTIPDYEVHEKMKKVNKPKSGVPGDPPSRLIKEFTPELVKPAGVIYRNITETGQWPSCWKVEYGTALKKVTNPANEDQLRIISLTSYFSKVYEQLVIEWLLEYVGDQIDWNQYGGVKGHSISHYLIEMINFILYNQDLRTPHAVLATMVDFSKAFNRQNHNLLLTLLSDMNVPGWLLKIVIGFLSDREMILRYKNQMSGAKRLPGGGPQGTILGLFLFLILINKAGFKDNMRNVGETITGPIGKRKPMQTTHLKYVDDLSLLEALNLKKDLVNNPELIRPVNYHERTGHTLPANKSRIQDQLVDLKEYTIENEMKINHGKSKVMLFNTARSRDFMPGITLDGNSLEVVEEMPLLGLVLTSDLKWSRNTENMCKKAYNKKWLLRRLKAQGADTCDLKDIFEKQIRSVLEFGTPVYTAGLTNEDKNNIERVQRTAAHVILGVNYTDYKSALDYLSLDTLEKRRIGICTNFAKKAVKHPKFSSWFVKSSQNSGIKERQCKPVVEEPYLKPVKHRTKRYRKSPIPFLTNLINNTKK